MNRTVYYPFGKIRDVDSLKMLNAQLTLTKEIAKDPSLNSYELMRLAYKNSFIKFFKRSDTGFFEIVSARMSDKEITLPNYVHIGMALEDFLDLYFEKNINRYTQKISTVQLISGVDGIWQYYHFKNGVLSSINFNSDYTFNKD
ncbi:hypothetical protein [Mucilaginibacter agri]|uniref:Uncharacterized protein n=1 Tax=Mucilaginibacter agri TaxID=2695265 RepID=A0A965ZDV0_9SPHI|nr:hypothetical protein [Mucilaginibacter agri]NCD68900.1 hypothetical protein [Mucilaginibacter agri]